MSLFSLNCLGLDIGEFSIKLAFFKKNRLFYLSERFKTPHPSKKVIVDTILNGLAKLNYKEKEKFVVTSLKGEAVSLRFVTLPLMSKSKLLNVLRLEIDKYLPFKREETIFDVEILKKEKQKMVVLIAGTKNFIIEERLSIIKEIGLEPYLITTDSLALVEAFKRSELYKTETVALLDVGYSLSKLILIEKGIPFFSREIKIGDSQFLASLCERFNIDEERAQELKKEVAFNSKEVELVLQRDFKKLAEEIQICFDYCEYSFKKTPAFLCISGGGAKFSFLKNFFSQYFNFPVYEWDLLEKFKIQSSHDKFLFNTAIGLALLGK
ncbi:MAG: hypothetical protein B6D55_05155 [Candidatus Omnitrophica bacterium 4484_70.2]|nr:MAG: hypothetical protein B6D55_05155 [Candidatus Omnitrophica bacterium 4484_70.2]